jgi:hypothetical protein
MLAASGVRVAALNCESDLKPAARAAAVATPDPDRRHPMETVAAGRALVTRATTACTKQPRHSETRQVRRLSGAVMTPYRAVRRSPSSTAPTASTRTLQCLP